MPLQLGETCDCGESRVVVRPEIHDGAVGALRTRDSDRVTTGSILRAASGSLPASGRDAWAGYVHQRPTRGPGADIVGTSIGPKDEGAEAYEKRYQELRFKSLTAKAKELGYQLTPKTV
jgi:hypothetical protein